MFFNKLSQLVLVSAVALATQNAHAWKMGGIDTTLQLADPSSSIRLIDSKGQPLDLVGGTYRLRFSNQSKSFNIMANHDHIQEFKVAGGFPGGNLRDFVLPGAKFGNPGITLQGITRDVPGDSYMRREHESCTYRCGWDRVCRDVRDEVCRNDPRTGQRVCRDIIRRECDDVVRYCTGTEEWDVTYRQVARIFTLDIKADAQLTEPGAAPVSQSIGYFQGTVHTESQVVDRDLIHTSCR